MANRDSNLSQSMIGLLRSIGRENWTNVTNADKRTLAALWRRGLIVFDIGRRGVFADRRWAKLTPEGVAAREGI